MKPEREPTPGNIESLLEDIRENTHKAGHWAAVTGVLVALYLMWRVLAALIGGGR